MRALFIGGTGTISTAISHQLVELGWDLTLLNRGTHAERLPRGVALLTGDIGFQVVGPLYQSPVFHVKNQGLKFNLGILLSQNG